MIMQLKPFILLVGLFVLGSISNSSANSIDYDVALGILLEFGEDAGGKCGVAVAAYAEFMLASPSPCHDFLNKFTSFLSSFGEDGRRSLFSPSFDTISIPEDPRFDLVLDGICGSGKCASEILHLLDEIDGNCFGADLLALSFVAKRYIKVARVAFATVCVNDSQGDFCLASLVTELLTNSVIVQLIEDRDVDLSKSREVLCSSCSLNLQRDLFSILEVPGEFASMVALTCLRGEHDAFCGTDDIQKGFAYSLSTLAFDAQGYEELDLCRPTTCGLQAIALVAPLPVFDHEYPEDCFIPNKNGASISFAFENFNEAVGNNDDVLDLLRQDMAVAFKTSPDYIDIVFLNSKFVVSLNHIVVNSPEMTKAEMETRAALSPFANLKKHQGVYDDLTHPIVANLKTHQGVYDDLTRPIVFTTEGSSKDERGGLSSLPEEARAPIIVLIILVILMPLVGGILYVASLCSERLRNFMALYYESFKGISTENLRGDLEESGCCGPRCMCRPYKKQRSVLAIQVLSAIALCLSLGWYLPFIFGLVSSTTFQVACCRKIKPCAFLWAGIFAFVAFLSSLVGAIFMSLYWNKDCVAWLFLFWDDDISRDDDSYGDWCNEGLWINMTIFAMLFWLAVVLLTFIFVRRSMFQNMQQDATALPSPSSPNYHLTKTKTHQGELEITETEDTRTPIALPSTASQEKTVANADEQEPWTATTAHANSGGVATSPNAV